LDYAACMLGYRINDRVHLLRRRIVALHGYAGGALILEFGHVGARDERLSTRSCQNDDANVLVGREVVEDLRCGLPHLERNGVVTLGIVEDHRPDASILAGEHLVGRVHAALPQMIFSVRRRSISPSAKPNSRSTSA